MKQLILVGISTSILASISHFSDRIHTQIDNITSRNLDTRSISLSINDDDMSMLQEISLCSNEAIAPLKQILSCDSVSNGRIRLTLEQGEGIFNTLSQLS